MRFLYRLSRDRQDKAMVLMYYTIVQRSSLVEKRVRIGVIGVDGRGRIADHWAGDERAVITAGADVDAGALEDFRMRFGQSIFTTKDYRELLARPDVDAVAITSPDYCHEEQAVAALCSGKDVFCEKPLAISTQGCDRILAAWKQAGRRLMVGFNMRCMPMFQKMKAVVDSGEIGQIKAVWVRHFVGAGGDFYFRDWHASRTNTNSLLLQKGSHDIDMIHWITGQYTCKAAAFGGLDYYGGDEPDSLTCSSCPKKDSCPEASTNPRQQCVFRREVNVEDNQVVILELEGGIKASYLQCHFTPDYHRNYCFIGTRGRMENSEPEMKIRLWHRVRGRLQQHPDETIEVEASEGGHGGADPVLCSRFLDFLLKGESPVADPIAGRMAVAAGAAAAESLRSGGMPISLGSLPVF